MKSTLKRESKACEIVEREALTTRLTRGGSGGTRAGVLLPVWASVGLDDR